MSQNTIFFKKNKNLQYFKCLIFICLHSGSNVEGLAYMSFFFFGICTLGKFTLSISSGDFCILKLKGNLKFGVFTVQELGANLPMPSRCYLKGDLPSLQRGLFSLLVSAQTAKKKKCQLFYLFSTL